MPQLLKYSAEVKSQVVWNPLKLVSRLFLCTLPVSPRFAGSDSANFGHLSNNIYSDNGDYENNRFPPPARVLRAEKKANLAVVLRQ